MTTPTEVAAARKRGAEFLNILYDTIAPGIGDVVRLFWDDGEGASDDYYNEGMRVVRDWYEGMIEAEKRRARLVRGNG